MRGTIAMARRPNPNSATTQFFINVIDNPSQQLTYAAISLPPGLSINGSQITGWPTGPGTYTASVKVTDPDGIGDAASFTWLFCPVIDFVNSGTRLAETQVQKFLEVTPLSGSTNAPLEHIWSNFRDIAEGFFIVIFFVFVISDCDL